MGDKKQNLKQEKGAVSPVVGVIMMIAITVVLAGVVTVFAYDVIGTVKKAPNSAFIVENALVDATTICIVHHGGDSIADAFNGTPNSQFKNLKIKVNGIDRAYSGNVTGTIGDGDNHFESGEQILLTVSALSSGDSITMVFAPTNEVLQRVSVAG